MTTFAPKRDDSRKLKELEERTRRAWTIYRESLRDLDAGDYEDVEHRSWERLQRKLRELDDERSTLADEVAAGG
jgi:outer membrane protein assembly factor BamD (BamD/ComL family)